MVSTPAPSDTKRLTQPSSSMTPRRRSASASMSNPSPGTNPPWTSHRPRPSPDQPALDGVRDVRELDPAVAQRAPADLVQQVGALAERGGDLDGSSGQQAGVAVEIPDDLDLRRERGVALDQATDGGRQARGQAP